MKEILNTFSYLKCVLLTSSLYNPWGTGECEPWLSIKNLRGWCRSPHICLIVCADAERERRPWELLPRGADLSTSPLAMNVVLCQFTRWRYNLKNKHSHFWCKSFSCTFFHWCIFHFQSYFSLAFVFAVFQWKFVSSDSFF